MVCPNCDRILSYTKEFIDNNNETVCPFCNEEFSF